MNPTLSVAIMAHPAREDMVNSLLDELDLECDIPIVWDCGRGRWDTGRRAMLAYDIEATHHLVIQDDIIPCRDLIAGFRTALAATPGDMPLCGYVGRVRPDKDVVREAVNCARQAHASFITMHTLNWGPAVCVPTKDIMEMIAFCDTLTEIENYDRRMSRYWELRRHVRTWYTWPCLVDHADGPSLVPGRVGTNRKTRAHARIAHQFLGEEVSGLSVDWSGPVVHAACPGQPTVKVTQTGDRSLDRIPVAAG